MTQAENKILDLKGLRCPLPVLRLKKEMKKMKRGQVIEVLVTDPGAAKDFQLYCDTTGEELVSYIKSGEVIRFEIRKIV